MAIDRINYRVETKQASGEWWPWTLAYCDLAQAKRAHLAALKMPRAIVRDARIVEVRYTVTETVLSVDAANPTILSREEI